MTPPTDHLILHCWAWDGNHLARCFLVSTAVCSGALLVWMLGRIFPSFLIGATRDQLATRTDVGEAH